MNKQNEEKKDTTFMNPLTDVGFKIFFEKNMASTLELLNDLLEGQEDIVSLTFMDKEIPRETMDGRNVIYDLYCQTSDGRRIIIEMQRAQQQNFKERALYYMCRNVVMQGEPGNKWEYQLDAVYGIFFLDFELEGKQKKQLMREILLSEKTGSSAFYEKFRMYFIELPAFEKSEKDCATKMDCWIYILKNMEHLNTFPFKGWLKTLNELEETMRVASLDKNGRELYEASLKRYRDINAFLSFQENKLKKGLEEGRAKAIEEGLAKGLAEGLEKGLAEGRAEGLAEGRTEEKLDNARNFKALGVSPEIIQQATGLTLKEIETL